MCADEDQHSDENTSTYNIDDGNKRRSTIFTGRATKQMTSLLTKHMKTISGSSLRAESVEIAEESEKSSFGTDSDHDEDQDFEDEPGALN